MAAPKTGGFKLSLAGAKNKVAPKGPTTNLARRPRLALDDDEPEDSIKHQEISGWDTTQGGAVDLNGKKKEEKPLPVIAPLPNRNWREEVRRKHAARTGGGGEGTANVSQAPESKIAYGLTVIQKRPEEDQDATAETSATEQEKQQEPDNLTAEQRLEKNALEALLHGRPAAEQNIIPALNEEEVFQADIKEAPDAPSLDAYEATPIEGFGAALLRGMGWKDGEGLGRDKSASSKPRSIKRRPALLGIGAKDEAAVGIELGEWEKGKAKRKVAQTYNPVALRNKITGELITEQELKARMERQELVKEEKAARKDKYDDGGEERRVERRKERRRDDEYDSERKKDRRDDRRRDDSYEDRRREKRSDRRDRDRDRDRERGSYPDDRRDRRYERKGRSKSPASDDRRKRRRDYDDGDDRDDRKRRHKDDRHSRK